LEKIVDQPLTNAGRRIIAQDYRGNESYTVTREDILDIEREAAATATKRFVHLYHLARLVSQWHESLNSGPLEELDAELGELRRVIDHHRVLIVND
jgi:hypothetical protein